MNKITNLKLFTTLFKINALTFGGGYTIVPVISDVFVKDLNLLDEDEMLDIVALAQAGPGAMAISTSLLTGYKINGPLGAITCLIASTLPCIITLSIVSIFYKEFQTNFFIRSALDGISGIICAVLLITVYGMAKKAFNNYKIFSSIIIILSFIAGFFFKINTVSILILSALIGICVFYIKDRSCKND